jgi:hypothetical protein
MRTRSPTPLGKLIEQEVVLSKHEMLKETGNSRSGLKPVAMYSGIELDLVVEVSYPPKSYAPLPAGESGSARGGHSHDADK